MHTTALLGVRLRQPRNEPPLARHTGIKGNVKEQEGIFHLATSPEQDQFSRQGRESSFLPNRTGSRKGEAEEHTASSLNVIQINVIKLTEAGSKKCAWIFVTEALKCD